MAPGGFAGHTFLMNNKRHFPNAGQLGAVLSALLLAALTDGAGNAEAQKIEITLPVPVVVAPPVVVVPDDYVYYPSYGVYYNAHRRQYYYMNGNVWVTQPQPMGVTAEVLLASPSVNMDFHDSPANHHAEMLKRYPREWKPPGDHQDHHEAVHDEHHEDHHDGPKGGEPDDHKR
jgi:hypothetical protein